MTPHFPLLAHQELWLARELANQAHVSTKPLALLREAWLRFNRQTRQDPKLRDRRKAFYREILKTHQANRDLMRAFRL